MRDHCSRSSRWSLKFLITLALTLSMAAGAAATSGDARQRAGAEARGSAWLTAEHADMLRRSYLRCHHARTRDAGMPASRARSARSYAHDIDVMSGEISDRDIAEAPKETSAGVAYIACRWFGPLLTPRS